MANIITVSAYQYGTTPPSKAHNIGIGSILDVVPYTQPSAGQGTAVPFINSIVYTSNPVLTALYCNETAAAIKAQGNAPLA